MDQKKSLLELLKAECEYFDSTMHLSEEEQIKADLEWARCKNHQQLCKILGDAYWGDIIKEK